MLDDREWLKAVKAGDEVILRHGGGWSRWETFETVTRVTDNFVMLGRQKFRRRDGYEAGASVRHRDCIVEATPERKARIEAARRRSENLNYLQHQVKWAHLEDEKLAAVVGLVKQLTAESTTP